MFSVKSQLRRVGLIRRTRRNVVTLPLYYFVMGHWSIRVTSETFNIQFRDSQPGVREPVEVHNIKDWVCRLLPMLLNA